MKPVDQLTLHSPTQRGDCMRACLASILEVNPQAMPNFAENRGPMSWWDEMRRWLRDDWPALGHGGPLDLVMVASLDDVIAWGADPYAYAIATVASPRGPWGHCVVVDPQGVIVHDPFPEPDGKVTGTADVTDDYWLLTEPYEPWPTPIGDRSQPSEARS